MRFQVEMLHSRIIQLQRVHIVVLLHLHFFYLLVINFWSRTLCKKENMVIKQKILLLCFEVATGH